MVLSLIIFLGLWRFKTDEEQWWDGAFGCFSASYICAIMGWAYVKLGDLQFTGNIIECIDDICVIIDSQCLFVWLASDIRR